MDKNDLTKLIMKVKTSSVVTIFFSTSKNEANRVFKYLRILLTAD